MSQLLTALNSTATTNNGCETNHSSLDANLDLFFLAGASRGKSLLDIASKAWVEDPELLIRNILHTRDIRGGLGERNTAIELAKYVIPLMDTPNTVALLKAFVEVGRWKDVKELMETSGINATAVSTITSLWVAKALTGGGLAAKWLPVKDSKGAKPFRKEVGMDEHTWRKRIVAVRKTTEQQVCANQWSEIEYRKVPSLAMKKYYSAFFAHDEVRFKEYIEGLTKGSETINASTLFPHDITCKLNASIGFRDTKIYTDQHTQDLLNAQWNSLPNYLEGCNENILSVIDTSGSMATTVAGSIKAIDIALGLGIYCAERSEGIFKNSFISFSHKPKLHTIKGTLTEKVLQVLGSDWEMNTDLEAVFTLILDTAVKHNIPESEMPTKLLIVSDMQFDACCNGSANSTIREKYKRAGYKVPNIVFWAVKAPKGNIPVTVNNDGTALISGFNPAIIPSILGDDISPIKVLKKALMKDRYDLNSYM